MANKAKTPEQINKEKFAYAEGIVNTELYERARDSNYKNQIPKPPKGSMGIPGYKKRLNEWVKGLKELEYQLNPDLQRRYQEHEEQSSTNTTVAVL